MGTDRRGNFRYLIVGEAPAPNPKRRHLQAALAFRAAGLPSGFASMVKLAHEDELLYAFFQATAEVNVLDKWPGRSGAGSAFPVDEARAAADKMLASGLFGEYSRVLLAGRRVTEAFAFGLGPPKYFEPVFMTIDVVPHPSGVNRWWNEAGNREKALAYLRGLGNDVLKLAADMKGEPR